MGRPPRCVATGCPGTVLSIYVVMWNCSRAANSLSMCSGEPWASKRASFMFAFTISDSLCVRSSSDLLVPSIMTEGRTAGGGTGKAVSTIQAGRDHFGSNPSALQSSSLMAFRMSCAFSAVSSCLSSVWSGGMSSSALGLGNSIMMRVPSRRYLGSPFPVKGHSRMPWQAAIIARSLASGFLRRCAILYLTESFGSMTLELW
mmetsp:Transcript_6579/g.18951  ORF Transcript_6579/g.18951 Transcript_6579/m.18951 type:complete len:202 (-) Transcript_6579:536-1141(-)